MLVNNAGITRDKLLVRMSEADWDTVIDTNLKGVYNFTKPVVTAMLKQRSGTILNISSISGLTGMAGQANYSASKAGMIGFTKALAKEVAKANITVNALALGLIETDMTASLRQEYRDKALEQIPLGRFGQVSEVARIAAFLLSEEAGLHYRASHPGRRRSGNVITHKQLTGGLSSSHPPSTSLLANIHLPCPLDSNP